jgi:hypothetical protein
MLSSGMFITSYYFNWQCGQNKKASQIERLSSGHLGYSGMLQKL